jgi:hypothetical protein
MNQAALILGVFLLASNEAVQGSVDLVGLPGRVPPGIVAPAVFGATEQKMDLDIQGVDLPHGSVTAELFQVAGRLAMPIGRTIVLQDGVNLSATIPRRMAVSIKFPPVKERAEIRIRLSAAGLPSGPIPLGELRFEVFPRSLSKGITDMLPPLPNGTQRLVVFGAGKKLRPALRAMHLPFEDGGQTLPGIFNRERIYMGDMATHNEQLQARDHSAQARLAVFSEDDSLPRGIYATNTIDQIFILVTSPLLDDLVDDPRDQMAFSKIVQLLSSSFPTN